MNINAKNIYDKACDWESLDKGQIMANGIVREINEMIEKEKMYNPTGAYRKGRLTAMKEIRTLVKNY